MSEVIDVFQALKTAIRMEDNSFNGYIRFSEESDDAEVESLFRQIADDEKAHKEILESELQALKETQQGQTKRPSYWMQLLEKDSDAGLPQNIENKEIQRYLLSTKRVNKILKEANDELIQQKIRQEHELEIADEIQNSLLPKELPEKSGLEISATNIMASHVGGDYYDCIANKFGQLAFVVADVMGKGIPAALIMTAVRAIWRSNAMMARTPNDILSGLNHAVYADFSGTGRFVTMFTAVYNPNNLTLKYGNSGHNPPLYLSCDSNEFEELDTDGTLIGIMPDSKYYTAERVLNEGDLIVIYTDGIVEAERNEELFGTERLKEVITQNRFCEVKEIRDKIISAVKEYSQGESQSDDITLMVLRVIGSEIQCGEFTEYI